MIVKGVLFTLLVWLCMAQGPRIDLADASPCAASACADPLAARGASWRGTIYGRLSAMKQELRAERLSRRNIPLVESGRGREAGWIGRFASALPR